MNVFSTFLSSNRTFFKRLFCPIFSFFWTESKSHKCPNLRVEGLTCTFSFRFLVLEHVSGGELFDYLVKRGRLPLGEVFFLTNVWSCSLFNPLLIFSLSEI